MALGYEHPDFLLSVLTAEQISEWEAFNRIQPIGNRRNDVYFATLIATLHNMAVAFSGNKEAKMHSADEFLPNWMGFKEEDTYVMPLQEMKSFWIDFAADHNKRVEEQLKRDKKPPKNLAQ